MAVPGDHIDGYRLIRPIGRGGFGTVWLCQVEATGEFKALKILPASDAVQLERELAALIRYRAVSAQIQSPNLLPIEHVNRTENGLFYSMPLADGIGDSKINDPAWQPKTLAALIRDRRVASSWFSPDEIQSTLAPLIAAAQALSAAGVVHRDIKPENILFIEGRPCLGDVSLLTNGNEALTQRGTPGYAAPRWYLESGGNPDMWGLSATLYGMITGNPPDKLGRASYLWPPQGVESVEKRVWNRFHQIIFRGTAEKESNRFPDLDAFAKSFADVTVRKPLTFAGIRISAVFRDCVIIWGLTSISGVGTNIAGRMAEIPNKLVVIAVFNGMYCLTGYIIVSCLNIRLQRRWRHMFAVTIMFWLWNLTNVFLKGTTFLLWLLGLLVLLIFMIIGGGIASLCVKAREIFRKLPKSNMKLHE